jgi:hypothetical protein
MNREEKLLALEQQARARATHGWVFRTIPSEQVAAIRCFLDGGPCPEEYRAAYATAREQLKLGPKDWHEAFAEAAAQVHPGWNHTVDLTADEEAYCEAAADSKAIRPPEERS